jgi:hypothetical protein
MVSMDSHHLKLYSECWTTLQGDGEGRVLGWVGWVESQKADFSTSLRSGRNDGVWYLCCAPVEMTMFDSCSALRSNDEV